MRRSSSASQWCPNEACDGKGRIALHGFSKVKWGRRRGYRCTACVHAQVIKKIKQNCVVKVGTKLAMGSEWRLQDALEESEDSSKVNTAFIERLNLTTRQGSAHLNRRSPCHARKKRTLDDHLELLRCHYNFCRPHSPLNIGKVVRTPAMHAGLASRKLSFRDFFTARVAPAWFVLAGSRGSAYHSGREILKCAA